MYIYIIVGLSGPFIQLRMLPDIIQDGVYHCTLLQRLNTLLPPLFQTFQAKRRCNRLVLKMKILIDRNQGC